MPTKGIKICGCTDNYLKEKSISNIIIEENNPKQEIDVKGFIESYNANNNYFYFDKNIRKIQSVYKGYKIRKNMKKKKKENIKNNIKKESQKKAHIPRYSCQMMLPRKSFDFRMFKNEMKDMEKNVKRSDELSKEKNIIKKVENNKKVKKVSFVDKNIETKETDTQLKSKELENNDESNLEKYIFQTKGSFMTNIKSVGSNGKEEDLTPRGCFTKKSIHFNFEGSLNKKDNKKNGYGKICWDDGSILLANFTDNKINGIAHFIDESEKSEFSGEYNMNKPDGYGIYKKNGTIIEGEWKDNILTGIAFEYSEADTYYQGDYKNCQKDGVGVFRWSDGTLYKGEFVDNMMKGYGIIYWTDDRVYIGEIENGIMNGYGEFIWTNYKKKYMGFYRNDLKHGFGIYIDGVNPTNGYVGFWEKGKMNGVGIKISKGVFNYGIWNNGKNEMYLNGPWEFKKYCNVRQYSGIKFLENKPSKILEFIEKKMEL